MDRPPRLVLVLDWDLDDATWRPAVADELRDRLVKLARGVGYEPVLDGPEHVHVQTDEGEVLRCEVCAACDGEIAVECLIVPAPPPLEGFDDEPWDAVERAVIERACGLASAGRERVHDHDRGRTMIAAQILDMMTAAATYERAVRATMLDAIACARADGAPISEAAESEARMYFARQRRMRATLAVCVWLAGGA